jgi:hypothetical protein
MVAAVAMVRDEEDIIGVTARWMASQVDFVIVADNMSTDGTRSILDTIDGVTVVDDREPGYYQSQKMTGLAKRAAEMGATWVVPFDADEVHLPRGDGRIADRLLELPDDILVSEAPLFDHVATAFDSDDANPVARMKWRRSAQAPLRKVACRVRDDMTIDQGNHGASYRHADVVPMVGDRIEVRHFPYRSPEQMVRKARNGAQAYAATDLPAHIGQHWRDYGQLIENGGEEALHDVFRQWFWDGNPAMNPDLVRDPCPTL